MEKPQKLRELSDEELKQKERELKRQLFNVRFLVETLEQHPLYKKYYIKRKKFYAHDEHEQAHEGDLVRIVESRPLSRLKRWRLVEVLERARPGQR
jgi:small subunit ribosomal protein S17